MRSTSPARARSPALTDPAFANSIAMDKKAQRLLVSRSSAGPAAADLPRRHRRAAHRLGQRESRSTRAHPYAPYVASHEAPRFGTIKAEDGTTLHWRMVTPKLVAGQALPGVLQPLWRPARRRTSPRAGAASSSNIWSTAGYIWFEIDNRGSDKRGVAFESALYRAHGQRRGRRPEGRRAVSEVAAVRRSGARSRPMAGPTAAT